MYILIARRWGDSETHCYPVGIYEDLELAKHDGYANYVWRGVKYEPEIWETDIRTDSHVPPENYPVYTCDNFIDDVRSKKFENDELRFVKEMFK